MMYRNNNEQKTQYSNSNPEHSISLKHASNNFLTLTSMSLYDYDRRPQVLGAPQRMNSPPRQEIRVLTNKINILSFSVFFKFSQYRNHSSLPQCIVNDKRL